LRVIWAWCEYSCFPIYDSILIIRKKYHICHGVIEMFFFQHVCWFNANYSAPSKNQIFRHFFLTLNMFAIVSENKILFFVKTPRNNFSDPQTTNPNKTRRKHFWSSVPQKNPTKLTIPYKMVSLLRYFVILLFLCCTK